MARPITTFYNLSVPKDDSPTNCPLNNPDLPIVSDTEHRAGHCFCHHCKCGLHICPGTLYKSSSPSSGWHSHYKQTYKKKQIHKAEPIIPKEYKSFLNGNYKDGLSTVSQMDFKANDSKRCESCKPRAVYNQMKFSGRTSYERDFAEWKADHLTVKSPKMPYRGYMIKPWHCDSVYKTSFKDFSVEPVLSNKKIRSGSVKTLMTPEPVQIFDTTSKKFFQADRPLGSATPDLGHLRNKKDLIQLLNPKSHYNSSYCSEFSFKPLKPSLNRLR